MPQATPLSPKTFLLKSDLAQPITEAWFDPDFWHSQHALAGTGHGRGAVWFVDSQYGQFVLRRYRRGGLISKFNKSSFLFTNQQSTRPWQELELLEKMYKLELPVPKPVGGLYSIQYGFYQASLLIETIPNAEDLFALIKNQENSHIPWREIGKMIKRFHDCDIYHSDLNCHNIMIDKKLKIWLIDFDKCQQKAGDTHWQEANIERLKRSLDKESNLHTTFNVSEEMWLSFLEGYNG